MTPAERWAAELRRQQARAGITSRALSAMTGVDKTTLSDYRSGRALPRLARASVLADALDAPSVLRLCVELRTVRCEECEGTFVRDQAGGQQKRWCGKACADRYRQRVTYASDRRWNGKRYDTWRRIALRFQQSVEAMCRACEPEGVCRTPECELRAVSPLPLVERAKVRVA